MSEYHLRAELKCMEKNLKVAKESLKHGVAKDASCF